MPIKGIYFICFPCTFVLFAEKDNSSPVADIFCRFEIGKFDFQLTYKLT